VVAEAPAVDEVQAEPIVEEKTEESKEEVPANTTE
jgi:hypothetical protein